MKIIYGFGFTITLFVLVLLFVSIVGNRNIRRFCSAQLYVRGYPTKYNLLEMPPYRNNPAVQQCINLAEYKGNSCASCKKLDSQVIRKNKL